MFLVSTRSPRLVEHFRSCPDEIRRSDFHISKKEAREEKNKINKSLRMLSVSTSSSSFFFYSLFVYFILLLFLSGTHMSSFFFFFHFFVRFSSETNHFVPVLISFIIIEYFLNVYHFSRFF